MTPPAIREPRRAARAPVATVPGLGPCFSQIFMRYFESKLTVLYLCLKSHIISAMFHVKQRECSTWNIENCV